MNENTGASVQLLAERAIAGWLTQYVALLLQRQTDGIDEVTEFERMGFDSSAAVGMAGDLSDWLDHGIDPSIVYDHPSIRQLSRAIACDEALREKLVERLASEQPAPATETA